MDCVFISMQVAGSLHEWTSISRDESGSSSVLSAIGKVKVSESFKWYAHSQHLRPGFEDNDPSGL